MQIVVATHNEGKLVEIRRILEEDLGSDAENIELVSAGSLHLPDPVETGVTFQENALLKARAVAIRTGLPAVADDSGLIVDVMGNAPGILSARWAGAHGHDKANNALLLAQIEDIPDDKRTARFRCAAALVVPDTAGKWPYVEDVTANFMYLRLHGDKQLYASGYSAEALQRWGDRIERWAQGKQPADAHLVDPHHTPRRRKHRDVFCFFDNDIKVRAPFDARQLLQRFGLDQHLLTEPGRLPEPGVLP